MLGFGIAAAVLVPTMLAALFSIYFQVVNATFARDYFEDRVPVAGVIVSRKAPLWLWRSSDWWCQTAIVSLRPNAAPHPAPEQSDQAAGDQPVDGPSEAATSWPGREWIATPVGTERIRGLDALEACRDQIPDELRNTIREAFYLPGSYYRSATNSTFLEFYSARAGIAARLSHGD